jgi:hypothetical protein
MILLHFKLAKEAKLLFTTGTLHQDVILQVDPDLHALVTPVQSLV